MARSRAAWEALARELRPEARALINGEFRQARDGRTFDTISPIDGRLIAAVARCDAADIDDAVTAARASFETGHWRQMEPPERKRILLRFAELVRADLEHLALLETLDVGKPIQDSLASDVPSTANCIAYYAEFADKLYDEIAPTGPKDLALIRREPLGVIGAIIPWNYPLVIAAWKLGPALLAGNSVVLKPAEQSPLGAIRLGELALQAGVPPGVLNVVPGYGEEAGQALARHPDVDMVTFTGSTQVGKLMMRYAGDSNLKRVALELGGKSPQIVLRDADIGAAATDIAWAIFYNQGESCNAGSRLICDAGIKSELLAEVKRVAATITLGHPLDPSTKMGALIDAGHMQRVLGYIDTGLREGAELALGGRQALRESGGCYVEATILDRVKPSTRVAREEIFGPVLAVTEARDESEALRLANDSIFGLAAAVWTRDMDAAHRVSNALRAGTVWVNTYFKSAMTTPFGGFRQSGFGRDRSPHAIEKYTDLKTIWTTYR
ncbi:MAG: aldehyde dehydrogenase [Gammaproteobacteria bacterium]|nr:aldehyde dehydrogenase [Gammaproteobacteria bacterium]